MTYFRIFVSLEGLFGALSFKSLILAMPTGGVCVRVKIEEFLFHLPFIDRGDFLWCVGVCSIIWDI